MIFLLDKDTKPGTSIINKEKGNIEGSELPSTGEYSLLIGGILMIFSGVFIVKRFLCK